MATTTDLTCDDGRTLRVYDSELRGAGPAVFWHHGTPQTGALPEPLLPAAARRGIRLVSHDRPGYGGSTPQPGRTVASVAGDVARIADALGIDRFAVLGASGGGPHALACAALLGDRVGAAVSLAGLAPVGAEGLDWFAGMYESGAAELRAAAAGRAALEAHLAADDFDPQMFTPGDFEVLAGDWAWLGRSAGQAMAGSPDGFLDDDLAYAAPWGFDPADITAPVLFVHGGEDRVVPSAHSDWLARRCRSAELWPCPQDGHVSVLTHCERALDWLCTRHPWA